MSTFVLLLLLFSLVIRFLRCGQDSKYRAHALCLRYKQGPWSTTDTQEWDGITHVASGTSPSPDLQKSSLVQNAGKQLLSAFTLLIGTKRPFRVTFPPQKSQKIKHKKSPGAAATIYRSLQIEQHMLTERPVGKVSLAMHSPP